jgi:hypothetical protein
MKIKVWIAILIAYVFMISLAVLMSRIFEYITPVGPWLRSLYTVLSILAITIGSLIAIIRLRSKK